MPSVVVELQRDRQNCPALVAQGFGKVEHGGVVLAELRIDRPGGSWIIIDGRGYRQAALLERRPRLRDLHRDGLSSCQRMGRDLDVAEGEVAVARTSWSAPHHRRVRQRL